MEGSLRRVQHSTREAEKRISTQRLNKVQSAECERERKQERKLVVNGDGTGQAQRTMSSCSEARPSPLMSTSVRNSRARVSDQSPGYSPSATACCTSATLSTACGFRANSSIASSPSPFASSRSARRHEASVHMLMDCTYARGLRIRSNKQGQNNKVLRYHCTKVK